VDRTGAVTTEPGAIAATLPAVGGGKGFGIAVLVDLLAGALTGAAANVGVPSDNSQVGVFMLVVSPAVFGEAGHFEACQDAGATAVRDASARWPGDRSETARKRNLTAGTVAIAEKIFENAVSAVHEIDAGIARDFRELSAVHERTQ
jgi:LDH2 family malate/lactate/ureidoglycolate dehydrogenase